MRYFALACTVLVSVVSLNAYASTLAFLKGTSLYEVSDIARCDYQSVPSSVTDYQVANQAIAFKKNSSLYVV